MFTHGQTTNKRVETLYYIIFSSSAEQFVERFVRVLPSTPCLGVDQPKDPLVFPIQLGICGFPPGPFAALGLQIK